MKSPEIGATVSGQLADSVSARNSFCSPLIR
jgi:hypothetical protein